MPRLTGFLPDINVWLALASPRHVHSPLCVEWLNQTEVPILFCRLSQMGFLRLLTNASAMGPDVLSSNDAWGAYHSMLCDERIGFAPEPFALEEEWRKTTLHPKPMAQNWTDAYLAAFAQCAGLRLATLDCALASKADQALLLTARSDLRG